jgi:hypothetical protein
MPFDRRLERLDARGQRQRRAGLRHEFAEILLDRVRHSPSLHGVRSQRITLPRERLAAICLGGRVRLPALFPQQLPQAQERDEHLGRERAGPLRFAADERRP